MNLETKIYGAFVRRLSAVYDTDYESARQSLKFIPNINISFPCRLVNEETGDEGIYNLYLTLTGKDYELISDKEYTYLVLYPYFMKNTRAISDSGEQLILNLENYDYTFEKITSTLWIDSYLKLLQIDTSNGVISTYDTYRFVPQRNANYYADSIEDIAVQLLTERYLTEYLSTQLKEIHYVVETSEV